MNSFAILKVAVICCFLVLIVTENVAELGFMPYSVRVSATGEAHAEPDVAYVSLVVDLQDATMTEARKRGAEISSRIVESALSSGIENKDLTTARFSTHPVHEWRERSRGDRRSSRITVGFRYRNEVIVKVRDLDNLSKVSEQLLDLGGDDVTLQGIRFEVEDRDAVEIEARTAAIVKAKKFANALASGAGSSVGKVIRIESHVNYGMMNERSPVYMMDAMTADAGLEMAPQAPPSTPISPGEHRVFVTVDAEFLIENN